MFVVVEKDLTTGFVKVYGGFYNDAVASAWAMDYSVGRSNYDYTVQPIFNPPGLPEVFYYSEG